MLSKVGTVLMAGAIALGIVGCAPTAQNTAQSLAQEQRAAEGFVADLQSKGQLIEDPGLNRYVRGVVARISDQRPPGSVPLQAYIIKDASVNAFTPGGGYVFFHAGLIAAMENEAQFATVTAHEIAHIDRGHIQAGRATRQGVQMGAAAAAIGGALLGINPSATEALVGLGANYAVNSFTRTQETDADNTGIRYLAASGYNAVEGARSFEVLRRLYGDQRGAAAAFFSSHPASSERQASLTAQARQLGATRGRIGNQSYDRATRKLRNDILKFYDSKGMSNEAAQVRRALR
ncbi:MAG: M48 family metalloprotease [Pseudomonadota bacterium]